MILSREEFTGAQHRLHTVPVNANSSHVQCSVIASGARSARDRVLHFLPREVKFYSFSFHVIDLFPFQRLFQPNRLLYYLEQGTFTEHVCYSTK